MDEFTAAATALAVASPASPALPPPPTLPDILRQQRHYTADSTFDLLRRVAPTYMSMVDARYTFGIDEHPQAAGKADRRAWSNPLATALPHAPGLAIACMYGVGKESELGYAFRGTTSSDKTVVVRVGVDGEVRGRQRGEGLKEEETEETEVGETEGTEGTEEEVFVPVELDPTVNNDAFSNGVRSGDGDGTVPLASLGLMCVHPGLWKGDERGRRETAFNPAGVTVRTREYLHEPLKDIDLFAPLSSAVQGGGGSSDHVDILGNLELQRDLLLMATSRAHEGLVEDRVVSRVEEIAKRFVL